MEKIWGEKPQGEKIVSSRQLKTTTQHTSFLEFPPTPPLAPLSSVHCRGRTGPAHTRQENVHSSDLLSGKISSSHTHPVPSLHPLVSPKPAGGSGLAQRSLRRAAHLRPDLRGGIAWVPLGEAAAQQEGRVQGRLREPVGGGWEGAFPSSQDAGEGDDVL